MCYACNNCGACGKAIADGVPHCLLCGAILGEGDSLCPSCGFGVVPPPGMSFAFEKENREHDEREIDLGGFCNRDF